MLVFEVMFVVPYKEFVCGIFKNLKKCIEVCVSVGIRQSEASLVPD